MEDIITIDISGLFGGDDAARAHVDARIIEAIRSHGAFVIAGFPGEAEVDALASRMIRFFEQPEAAKFTTAKVSSKPGAPNMYRGYEWNLKPGAFAYNEMFDIGPAAPSPAPTASSAMFAEANIWPEVEPVDGWRAAMERYYETLHGAAMAVLHSVGRSAGPSTGMSAEALDRTFLTGNSTLRLINYPVPPAGIVVRGRDDHDDDLEISAASHTDGSGLSILWSLQPGLQAQAPDGTWRAAPQSPNALSIHLGDVFSAMTGGAIPATPHRVIGQGAARQSVGFFLEPRLDVALDLAKQDGGEAAFRDTYGWLLQKRFSGYEGYAGIVSPPE